MKFACILLLAGGLCSCNTTIGVGRDIKEGFVWSKRKIEEKRAANAANAGGGQQDTYQDSSGAPVY